MGERGEDGAVVGSEMLFALEFVVLLAVVGAADAVGERVLSEDAVGEGDEGGSEGVEEPRSLWGRAT